MITKEFGKKIIRYISCHKDSLFIYTLLVDSFFFFLNNIIFLVSTKYVFFLALIRIKSSKGKRCSRLVVNTRIYELLADILDFHFFFFGERFWIFSNVKERS